MHVEPQSGRTRISRRVRVAVTFTAAATLAAGAASAVATTATAATTAPRTSAAPALDGAAKGGAVIVWLKDQHKNLNLRTQSAQRKAAAFANQKPIVASIKAHGGTHITQLVSVNAVAAHVNAAEVARLRANPAVKQIVPDSTVTIGDPQTAVRTPTAKRSVVRSNGVRRDQTTLNPNPSDPSQDTPVPGTNDFTPTNNCGTQAHPMIEPEALQDIHAPAMTDAGLDTEPGHGVLVANDGLSGATRAGDLVGNPNFVRPAADGGGSVVVDATPGDTTNDTDGEYFGDASSIAAQGTVEYQWNKELPYSGLPDSCYFTIVGDAPGASLVDTGDITTPPSAAGDPATMSESQIIAGIDTAVMKYKTDVISESYGYSNVPGNYASHYAANDAAVAAGVTVVVSSGDSGAQGTVSSPASDPLVIAAGATNTLRENAMAYGFKHWVNDDITPLSSGGTTPNNKLVDLVAPGYGGEAACSPSDPRDDCPSNTQTEAFGGTSEACPFIAGAAADVIQAYRDSHGGTSPTPAMVKEILTSTATDVDAPADEQGAGLLNIAAAVAAANQMPGSTTQASANSLIASPGQLDLSGDGGSTVKSSVGLYNTSSSPTVVTGALRQLGPEHQLGRVTTEQVTAPDPTAPVPADGAQAAADVHFTVPRGLDRLDADMIWPDASNGNVLNFFLFDGQGRLRQISYDYGTPASSTSTTGIGTVPDIQHVEVADPTPGTWTAEIKWGNGRSHLQSPPITPTAYRGTVSFKVSGQRYTTTPLTRPVVVPAHGSTTVPVDVPMPMAPGDHPASVQFVGRHGVATSLPIARRTLIPSGGGAFNTTIVGTVGRGVGQISTYDVNVAAGRKDLAVSLRTADTSADDPYTLFLIDPTGKNVLTHPVTRIRNGVPVTTQQPGEPFTVTTVGSGQEQTATADVPNPAAGTWEIDVELNLTISGKEFSQTVSGDLAPDVPVVTAATTSHRGTTITGSGNSGDRVTVLDASGATVCATTVHDHRGTWSCRTHQAVTGPVTATQTDAFGATSPASDPVPVTGGLGTTGRGRA